MRKTLTQTLSLGYALESVLMLYVGLGVACNSESPIVVVLSGSMEPAFQRGDLLFLTNPPSEQYMLGDILVYRIPGAAIPIVHRVVETTDVGNKDPRVPLSNTDHRSKSVEDQLLLTKGDNNSEDDFVLYNGLERIRRKHIIGKVRGFVPYVGYISIIMNDMPSVKYIIFSLIGLMTLMQRE